MSHVDIPVMSTSIKKMGCKEFLYFILLKKEFAYSLMVIYTDFK